MGVSSERAFSTKEALRFGWEKTRENLGFLVGTFLVSSSPSIAAEILGLDERDGVVPALLVIAAVIIQAALSIGLTKIHLRLARGESAEWRDLFSGGPFLLPYLGASILYALVVVFGLILLIVPGIIWAIKYGLYFYPIIDERAPPFAALQHSADITKGARWQLLLFGIVLGLVNVVGFFAFGIGLFVTLPVTSIAAAWVYQRLRERLVPAPAATEQPLTVKRLSTAP
jgi:uncharacterized membrane protein